jgi:hypothetical protein
MSLPFLLPVILDPCPLSSFLGYGLPDTHSHVRIKVRSIIILYFNLLIVHQGLGLLFLLAYISTVAQFNLILFLLAFLLLD